MIRIVYCTSTSIFNKCDNSAREYCMLKTNKKKSSNKNRVFPFFSFLENDSLGFFYLKFLVNYNWKFETYIEIFLHIYLLTVFWKKLWVIYPWRVDLQLLVDCLQTKCGEKRTIWRIISNFWNVSLFFFSSFL